MTALRSLRSALAFGTLAGTLAVSSGCDSPGPPPFGAELSVYATSNPSSVASDAVVRLDADLAQTTATFDRLEGATSLQSVAFDADGNAFLSVDLGSGLGGVVFVPQLCTLSISGCANPGAPLGRGTRLIAGDAAGLVAPKGLVATDTRLLVADTGSGSLRVFDAMATGNAAPLFVVSNLGASPALWDVAYDEVADRLFAAATDGTVLVFDAFMSARGASGPSRRIVPTDGGASASVNLHGIAYDAGRDLLVVSDVGSAASATDGQLLTIASASTASGPTAVRARVSGGATRLGNPVDLVLTRAGVVYVAEKANGQVLRFDDVLTATGASDVAPDASRAVTDAESVAVPND